MTDVNLLTISGVLVATLFGLLMAVLGWGGNRVIDRLDAVVEKLNDVSETLHHRINRIDRRVTVIETRIDRHPSFDDETNGDG